MRALICEQVGSQPRLAVREVDEPAVAREHVVVDVHAAGVNFADTLIVRGEYQVSPAVPFTPGGEAAGVVSAIGESVSTIAVGDRVIALGAYGAFAEKWLVPATQIVQLPPGVATVEAAAFGITYGTAYYALKDRGLLKSGETLLVLGAAGGAGSAAVEVGKAMGARVIAGASTREKLEFAQSLGADDLIDYRTEDLRERIRELTDDRGVDVVYDTVGGDFMEPALRGTGWNGRYLVIGFASGTIPLVQANLTLVKGTSVVGVHWSRSLAEEPGLHRSNFADLAKMREVGVLRPRVTQTYPLEDYQSAFDSLRGRSAQGKVVIEVAR